MCERLVYILKACNILANRFYEKKINIGNRNQEKNEIDLTKRNRVRGVKQHFSHLFNNLDRIRLRICNNRITEISIRKYLVLVKRNLHHEFTVYP